MCKHVNSKCYYNMYVLYKTTFPGNLQEKYGKDDTHTKTPEIPPVISHCAAFL